MKYSSTSSVGLDAERGSTFCGRISTGISTHHRVAGGASGLHESVEKCTAENAPLQTPREFPVPRNFPLRVREGGGIWELGFAREAVIMPPWRSTPSSSR